MMDGFPLILLAVFGGVAVLALWRQILMVLVAGLLSLTLLGGIDVAIWIGRQR